MFANKKVLNNNSGVILLTYDSFGRMLLKQGPYGGKPVLQRVLIVTPSSLVVNWQNEFVQWLGRERLQTFVVDQVIPKFYCAVWMCYCVKLNQIIEFKYLGVQKKKILSGTTRSLLHSLNFQIFLSSADYIMGT